MMYGGLYAGTCVDNDDPERLMRIMALIPQVSGGAVVGWIRPCVAPGTIGLPYPQRVPALNQGVWIMYEGSDANKPIWMGAF